MECDPQVLIDHTGNQRCDFGAADRPLGQAGAALVRAGENPHPIECVDIVSVIGVGIEVGNGAIGDDIDLLALGRGDGAADHVHEFGAHDGVVDEILVKLVVDDAVFDGIFHVVFVPRRAVRKAD